MDLAFVNTSGVSGYAEQASVFGEQLLLISAENILRFRFLRKSPEFMANFAVNAVAANENITSNSGTILTYHDNALCIMIHLGNALLQLDRRLIL